MKDRLRKFEADELDDEQRVIYDLYRPSEVAKRPRAMPLMDEQGHLLGPINSWLLSPQIGIGLQILGKAIRAAPLLSPRSQEIIILVVAQRIQSVFERAAHETVARANGIPDDVIDALSSGTPTKFEDAEEQICYDLTGLMMDNGALSDSEYAHAVNVLGERKLFEVVAVVGWYQMIGLSLSVFQVVPPGMEETD